MSNSSDPDQARHFFQPDLGPNCLQRLSADNKSHHQQGKSEGKVLSSVGMQILFFSLYHCFSRWQIDDMFLIFHRVRL